MGKVFSFEEHKNELTKRYDQLNKELNDDYEHLEQLSDNYDRKRANDEPVSFQEVSDLVDAYFGFFAKSDECDRLDTLVGSGMEHTPVDLENRFINGRE